MTSRDFCFWLQGHFEMNPGAALTVAQVEMVRKHLSLVFIHEVDPSMGDAEHQAKLNEAHAKPSHPTFALPGEPVYRC